MPRYFVFGNLDSKQNKTQTKLCKVQNVNKPESSYSETNFPNRLFPHCYNEINDIHTFHCSICTGAAADPAAGAAGGRVSAGGGGGGDWTPTPPGQNFL